MTEKSKLAPAKRAKKSSPKVLIRSTRRLPRNVIREDGLAVWADPITGYRHPLPQKSFTSLVRVAEILNLRHYGVATVDDQNNAEPSEFSPLSVSEITEKAIEIGHDCGVYFLLLNGTIVYVGQSINCYSRITGHVLDGLKKFDSFSFVQVRKNDLDLVELAYIKKFNPFYNVKK